MAGREKVNRVTKASSCKVGSTITVPGAQATSPQLVGIVAPTVWLALSQEVALACRGAKAKATAALAAKLTSAVMLCARPLRGRANTSEESSQTRGPKDICARGRRCNELKTNETQ